MIDVIPNERIYYKEEKKPNHLRTNLLINNQLS